MGYSYIATTINLLKEYGLTNTGEIKYCVDRISNAYRRRYHCSDNFRLSINGQQDAQYNRQLENGCCGFYDEVIQLNSGTTVKFGFNYGH